MLCCVSPLYVVHAWAAWIYLLFQIRCLIYLEKLAKVKLSLYWIKHHAMKRYGESGVITSCIVSLGSGGVEWSASYPVRLTPTEEPPAVSSLDRRLGGSQSRSGCSGEEQNLEKQTPILPLSSFRLVVVLTKWLNNSGLIARNVVRHFIYLYI
jgi:hypothetical protein